MEMLFEFRQERGLNCYDPTPKEPVCYQGFGFPKSTSQVPQSEKLRAEITAYLKKLVLVELHLSSLNRTDKYGKETTIGVRIVNKQQVI